MKGPKSKSVDVSRTKTLQISKKKLAKGSTFANRYEIVEEEEHKSNKRLELRLSKIFKWYKKDFEQTYGSLEAMLIRYLPAECRPYLESGDYTIEYEKYDWSLNRSKPTSGH